MSRGKGREISAHFLLTFNRGLPISTHAFEKMFPPDNLQNHTKSVLKLEISGSKNVSNI